MVAQGWEWFRCLLGGSRTSVSTWFLVQDSQDHIVSHSQVFVQLLQQHLIRLLIHVCFCLFLLFLAYYAQCSLVNVLVLSFITFCLWTALYNFCNLFVRMLHQMLQLNLTNNFALNKTHSHILQSLNKTIGIITCRKLFC